MATDHSHSARIGVVTRLKSIAPVTSIAGERIYGEKVPANTDYPLVRVGLMITSPFNPTCIEGMDATFNVDSVSDTTDAGQAYALSKAVVDALHTQFFQLSDDAHVVSLRWLGSTPRQENKLWRVMSKFRLTTQGV